MKLKFIEGSIWHGIYCFQCGRQEGELISSHKDEAACRSFRPVIGEKTLRCRACGFDLNLGTVLNHLGAGTTNAGQYQARRERVERHIRSAWRQYWIDGGRP